MLYTHLTDDNLPDKIPENSSIIFPFKCDNFQIHSFNAIESDSNLLISVPTSSGKTCCAEYAIRYNIAKNKRILYSSPIKSLSNEKYKEFKEKNICSVGLLTGDNKINPDADLIIITAEILRNSLLKNKEKQEKQENENLLFNVGCVIMDEVHFINEPERGKIWEETLILLDDSIQLVLLSATIDQVTNFASWLQSIKKKKLYLISSNKRIIPLSHSIFILDKLYTILDNNDNFMENIYYEGKKIYDKLKKEEKLKSSENSQINNLVTYLIKKDLLQTIFFSFSRIKCEEYAESINSYLLEPEEQVEALNIFDYYIAPYKKIYESLPQYIKIRRLLYKGVGFHHSGLIPILKEIVEIIFKKKLIKILFATETFAVGVNMPTRTIVFTNLSKRTNNGQRFLNTAEYKQMAGRAGRRGLDTMGTVILMTMYEYPELSDLKSVMVSSMPHIKSKFKIDYEYCLKTLNCINTDPVSLFHSSLLSKELGSFYENDIKYHKKLQIKLDELEKLYKVNEINEEVMNNCEKIYEKTNTNYQFGFNIKLTQKQHKELDKIKKSVPSDIYKNFYEIKELRNEINSYSDKIDSNLNYIIYETEKIYEILSYHKFMDITTLNLTPKGVIASMVNDCNGILLTELITRGILDKLCIQQIIAILSIFLNPPRTDDDDIFISMNLHNIYKEIQEIIYEYNKTEKNCNYILENQEYWIITNKYIDLTLNWVEYSDDNYDNLRLTTLQYLDNIGEYEGNFIKNMLKLYNILSNLKVICNIIKKYDLLQKLEKIDNMILKDIVNVNSLYLS
jgi:superfamily II RNA helicase